MRTSSTMRDALGQEFLPGIAAGSAAVAPRRLWGRGRGLALSSTRHSAQTELGGEERAREDTAMSCTFLRLCGDAVYSDSHPVPTACFQER
jgi:hypothetical protein